MIFGAFIGSATPVGGGVIAFPVLSFIKHVPSNEAASFCLAMQSFGMTAASIAIYRNKIKINKPLVIYSVLTATIGYIVAIIYIKMPFSPITLKIFFASFWLSFGIAIFCLRKNSTISKNKKIYFTAPKIFLLGVISIIGGMITSWIGNGVDVLFFCSLILIFSESESIATASSVVVMALMSIVSTVINYRLGNYNIHTLDYLSATIPVVIIFAPLGIIFATKKGDLFIRKILLYIVIIQYLTVAFAYFDQFSNVVTSFCVIIVSFLALLTINKLFKRTGNEIF
ncbi:sulfite exporter TauE/SafE family protein [Salmonella enterica subsp. enterica]